MAKAHNKPKTLTQSATSSAPDSKPSSASSNSSNAFPKEIKSIFFDFGGCLDAPGIHTRTLFLRAFQEEGYPINTPSSVSAFQEAYTVADQKILAEALVVQSSLEEMNSIMATLIGDVLEKKKNSKENHQNIAARVSHVQSESLKKNKPILEILSKKFQLGIISNFSGNLERILKDFELIQYFEVVTDSYHAGVTKPDPRLFEITLKKAQQKPKFSIMVGDNPTRDILPAHQLGFKTILITEKANPPLKNSSDKNEFLGDYIIQDLNEILKIVS